MKAPQAAFDRVNMPKDGAGPMRLNTLMDGVTAVVAQNPTLIPFRARIVGFYGKIRTVAGTAGYIIGLGTVADTDAFGTITTVIGDVAGTIVQGVVTDPIIPKDTVVVFTGDGGATTTGNIDVVVLLEPAGPA